VAEAAVAFYVSAHGFGHASRCAALLRALHRRAPALALRVRSQAPHWIFTERVPAASCSAAPVDPGVIQKSGLDVDRPATLAAHEVFVAGWEEALTREATWLREAGARVVVGDVPPLAFAAAARVGIASAAVGNFTWEWILRNWAAHDPRWGALARHYAEAYGLANVAFRLPLHAPDDFSCFARVRDAPLLVSRSARTRAACRAALGLAPGDARRLVLVSFGGFGIGEASGRVGAELSGYAFVGTRPEARRGLPGEWLDPPAPGATTHEDLMNACDAVIGKAGYGTIAEALAHETRFLFLPRKDFPEVPVLEAALLAHGGARAMPREDFAAGRWREHLDALFADRPPAPPPPAHGDEAIASELLALLG
jgi:L-arabinokinase